MSGKFITLHSSKQMVASGQHSFSMVAPGRHSFTIILPLASERPTTCTERGHMAWSTAQCAHMISFRANTATYLSVTIMYLYRPRTHGVEHSAVLSHDFVQGQHYDIFVRHDNNNISILHAGNPRTTDEGLDQAHPTALLYIYKIPWITREGKLTSLHAGADFHVHVLAIHGSLYQAHPATSHMQISFAHTSKLRLTVSLRCRASSGSPTLDCSASAELRPSSSPPTLDRVLGDRCLQTPHSMCAPRSPQTQCFH